MSYAAAGTLVGAFGSIGVIASGLLSAQMLLFVVANAFVVLLGLRIAGWGRLVLARIPGLADAIREGFLCVHGGV